MKTMHQKNQREDDGRDNTATTGKTMRKQKLEKKQKTNLKPQKMEAEKHLFLSERSRKEKPKSNKHITGFFYFFSNSAKKKKK